MAFVNKKPAISPVAKAIRTITSLDPEFENKLRPFVSSTILIELSDINRKFYIQPREDINKRIYLELSMSCEEEADTVLTGTLMSMLRLGLARDAAPLLLSGEIEIKGNVSLGKKFKSVVSNINVDWEECLSAVIGDIAAHETFRLGKQIAGWAVKAKNNLALDIAEYFQEESRDILSSGELETFYNHVDELRDGVDRLEARIKAFSQRIK